MISTCFIQKQQADINNVDVVSLPYATLVQFAHTPVLSFSFLSPTPLLSASQCLAYFASTSLCTGIFLVGQNKLYEFIVLVPFCNRTTLSSCYFPFLGLLARAVTQSPHLKVFNMWLDEALSSLVWWHRWPCLGQEVGLLGYLPTYIIFWFYDLALAAHGRKFQGELSYLLICLSLWGPHTGSYICSGC